MLHKDLTDFATQLSKIPQGMLDKRVSALTASLNRSSRLPHGVSVVVKVRQNKPFPYFKGGPDGKVWPVMSLDGEEPLRLLEESKEFQSQVSSAFSNLGLTGFVLMPQGDRKTPEALGADYRHTETAKPAPTENGFWMLKDQVIPIDSSDDDAPWVTLSHILPHVVQSYEDVSQHIMLNPPPKDDRDAQIQWFQEIGSMLLDKGWIMGWKGNIHFSSNDPRDELTSASQDLSAIWPLDSSVKLLPAHGKSSQEDWRLLLSNKGDAASNIVSLMSKIQSEARKNIKLLADLSKK